MKSVSSSTRNENKCTLFTSYFDKQFSFSQVMWVAEDRSKNWDRPIKSLRAPVYTISPTLIGRSTRTVFKMKSIFSWVVAVARRSPQGSFTRLSYWSLNLTAPFSIFMYQRQIVHCSVNGRCTGYFFSFEKARSFKRNIQNYGNH